MGLGAGEGVPSLDAAPRLRPSRARRAICGPGLEDSAACEKLVSALERAGVEAVLSIGGRCLAPGLCVLGAGWAGVVFLAEVRGYGLAAVKALRPGSRRKSMLPEALVWAAASSLGVAPPLLHAEKMLIIYRPVLGPAIAGYTPPGPREATRLLSALLYKVFLLDEAGIRHGELARPGDHVLVEEGEPFIIDYDSSSFAENPGNLTQLLGGLHRVPWLRRCRELHSSPVAREALRSYKRSPGVDTLAAVQRHVLRLCSPTPLQRQGRHDTGGGR